MANIERRKGVTVINLGNLTIRTDKINRYRYNDLKKLSSIKCGHVLAALGISKEKKPISPCAPQEIKPEV